MDRRTACTALVALSSSPQALRAQVVGRPARVGILIETSQDRFIQDAVLEPFRAGLRELGYVEGQNIVIELRSAEGKHEHLPALAKELVQLPSDVLVAVFPAPALAAKDATRTVPVVAAAVDDPVSMGLAATMARPGGNITGVSGFANELLAKRLELVRQLVPTARRIGILFNPNAGVTRASLERPIATWERALGIRVLAYDARGPTDFEAVFAALARDQVGGLVVLADANTFTHRALLNDLCLQRRMPSVWGGRDFLTGGAVGSYQSDFPAMLRRSAALVDKILKGEKPGAIPFEQSTKLVLVIDKRAARALGITVPREVLLSADEIVE